MASRMQLAAVQAMQQLIQNPLAYPIQALPSAMIPKVAKQQLLKASNIWPVQRAPSTLGSVVSQYYSSKYKSQILVLASGHKFNVREGRLY